MEKQKVYVVRVYYRMWRDEVLDSIWSRKEDAKRRIDDLANEYVRKQWYEQECDLENFVCKAVWSEDKMSVKMSCDLYEEDTYYVDVLDVNPEIPDFEGP